MPDLPEGEPRNAPPSLQLDLTVPEAPNALPERQLAPVEVPQVDLPSVESVTGALPNLP